jgi:hypothetical protein
MESSPLFLALSIGIGGAVFVGWVLFWFTNVYLKRRVGSVPELHRESTPSQRTGWEEGRSQSRLAVSWHASFRSRQDTVSAQIKDISLGGAFVVCPTPLPPSERFQIRVELPARGPIELNAMVVWSNVNVPPERTVIRGMGIRFLDKDEGQRNLLLAAITEALRSPGA